MIYLRFTIIYIFIFLISVLGCSKKNETPLHYSGKVIEFTNGGGFTGAFTSIFLLDDGQIYRNGMSDTSYIKVGNIALEKAKQVFNNFEKLGLNKLELNEPGNRYYYINMKSKNGQHKIQWGRNKLSNQNPIIYFNNIMHLVKEIEKTNANN
jgi:hypothetical protein